MNKAWLKQLLAYTTKVYGMKEKIKSIHEPRKRPQTASSTIFFVLLMGMFFRMESLNQLNEWIRGNRFKKLVPRGTRIPFMDTIRHVLKSWDSSSFTQHIHKEIIRKTTRNGVFRGGTIKGWKVVAIDGVELFESTKKSCNSCLTRVKKGVTHYFHRAVVCMSVGSDPHIVFGSEFLHPKQDDSGKNEGEQTGAKRLLKNLHQEFHHFADIIVADALYLNAPFIQTVLSCKMHAVIRMKDERLHIMKDARGIFQKRKADSHFSCKTQEKRVQVKVWKDSQFFIQNLDHPLSVYRFVETITHPNQGTKEKEVWVVTTLDLSVEEEVIHEIIHKRWDIENNGFRQLKTYSHLDHCFVHNPQAIEVMVTLQLIAFNLFQLFLFRRICNFRGLGVTQRTVVECMREQAKEKKLPFFLLESPKRKKRRRKRFSIKKQII